VPITDEHERPVNQQRRDRINPDTRL
jgi:hypothetical protein